MNIKVRRDRGEHPTVVISDACEAANKKIPQYDGGFCQVGGGSFPAFWLIGAKHILDGETFDARMSASICVHRNFL